MKTILVDAVFAFVSDQGEIFSPMHDLLEEYPNRKIILTNADYEVENKYNLNDMPYEVFTLKHNPPKTDLSYYKMLLEHFGFSKDDVVYFEHDQNAVKSAQSVGIKVYHYDENKRDLSALKEFLDENLK